MVYTFHKELYGLKQVPRAWYSNLDSNLSTLNLSRSDYELVVFFKKKGDSHLIIDVYVDNQWITRNQNFKHRMLNSFKMTNLRLLYSYLGTQVNQIKGEIRLF